MNTQTNLVLLGQTHTQACTPSAEKAKAVPTRNHHDIYMDYLLHGTGKYVGDTALHHFLVVILTHTDVQALLTRSMVCGGCIVEPRISHMHKQAQHFQNANFFEAGERDAVYVATILHGIHYWLSESVENDDALNAAMNALVQEPLQRLDRFNPQLGQTLRLCMGWDCSEAQHTFTHWLTARMEHAITTLDQHAI